MRLLDLPLGFFPKRYELVSSARAVSGGGDASIGGTQQTTASPFGLWAYRFDFPPALGAGARRIRGFFTALHGGANAVRMPFLDPDRMSLQDAGLSTSYAGQPWANDQPWGNGQNWAASYPHVAVSAAAAKGASIVYLADEFFGHSLDVGSLIGFGPLHFGMHQVTQVFAPGTYRIWPPLRKAITTSSYATLTPVLVMRPMNEGGISAVRDLAVMDGISLTMVEVPDDIVRAGYTD